MDGFITGFYMTYSDAIIKRLTQLCTDKNITVNKLATLSVLHSLLLTI